jgi:hypothetical protein
MKKLVYLISITFFLLGSSFSSTSTTELSGEWTLFSIKDFEKNEIKYEPDEQTKPIVISFQGNQNSGKIIGNTATNSIFAHYYISPNNRIFLKDITSSLIIEHGLGQDFWDSFSKVYAIEVTNDTLRIFCNKDKQALVFFKMKHPAPNQKNAYTSLGKFFSGFSL